MLSLLSRVDEADPASDLPRCTLTKGMTPKLIGRLFASEASHLVSPGEGSKAVRNWGVTDGLWSARLHGSTASAG